MEWKFDNERPIYLQLVEQIERAVSTGVFPPGEKLPGVRELAAEAGVNPNTMQRALAALEERGLLASMRTSGRFVTEDGDRIRAVRQEAARRVTAEFLAALHALQFTKDEVARLLRDIAEEY